MFEGFETEKDRLLKRRTRAIQFAQAEPEHALVEVRKALELVCKGLVKAAKITVRARNKNAPTLDEHVVAIEQHRLAPALIVTQFRPLQAAGNYGAHDQEDVAFLSPEYLTVCLAQLDIVLDWYLKNYCGAQLVDRSVELSGLASLRVLEAEERRAAVSVRGRTDAIPPPEGPELKAAELVALAQTLEKGRRSSAAVPLYERAFDLLVREGDLHNARIVLHRLTRLTPAAAQHWMRLGEAFVSVGPLVDALDALGKAAAILKAKGDLAELARVLERIAALDPSDLNALRTLASVYLRRHDAQRALRAISRCLTLAPRDPDVLAVLAECFDRVGHPEKARQVRKVLGEIAPDRGA